LGCFERAAITVKDRNSPAQECFIFVIFACLTNDGGTRHSQEILGTMQNAQVITLFTSYSHDSPEHEQHVLALSDRLRKDGIDANLDQYEQAPPDGWPFWMENQVRDSRFVLVVSSATYLRRVERREEPSKGHGVVWESNIIYNIKYGAFC
jgi:TIR domain-containing protein